MKIINLEKRLEDFHLHIDYLSIEENKIHGIIGNNGSGKSTLLKLIAGQIKPDNGCIEYGHFSMRDITIASQRPYFIHDTVYNNLIYPCKLRNLKLSKEEIAEWIEKCGLSGKEKQYAPGLSGGERQKLSFARALIFKPKVVLIDETLANLDPDSASLFEQIILDIQRKNPITWIIVSHQLVHIYNTCQQVHFMSQGRIQVSGTTKDIFTNTDNPEVKKYLSSHLI